MTQETPDKVLGVIRSDSGQTPKPLRAEHGPWVPYSLDKY